MSKLIVVVVVEDDPVVGEALTRTLGRFGCRCTLVLQADRAEDVLESERPDLIISDFSMPGRSGIDVLRAAKQRFPSVRRCLTSGAIHQMTQAEFDSVQPCQLLSKPWRLDDLVALLAAFPSNSFVLR